MQCRADITARTDKRHTPLSLSVKYGHLGVVKELISHGANTELVKNKVKHNIKQSPLLFPFLICVFVFRALLHCCWRPRKDILLL